MESKDGHLFSVLQTRKNGVLSSPRKIEPASVTSRDLLIARFVEKALTRIPRFGAALLNLLDAIGKGLSILEIVWEVREGQVWVRELKSRAPGRFSFAPDGTLRLSPDEFLARVGENESRSLPDRKFLRFTFGGLYDEPYGRGLCARAYWYYWFKKNNTKFWVIYNEKFGAPTVVGKYRPGASEEERRRLFDVVESLQNDTGVTVPESITLELLEARRSGNASPIANGDWCNAEISRLARRNAHLQRGPPIGQPGPVNGPRARARRVCRSRRARTRRRHQLATRAMAGGLQLRPPRRSSPMDHRHHPKRLSRLRNRPRPRTAELRRATTRRLFLRKIQATRSRPR
jgi:phage gp29-like protein